jgi:MOSC domain-containing protein YiiM
MRVLDQSLAVPGRGLRGDRYWDAPRRSTPASGHASAVTLIEAEALDALEREQGIHLAPADTRRNLLTRGLALNELVGREFRVGCRCGTARPGNSRAGSPFPRRTPGSPIHP